ncbi:MAG: GNAT family N-acetyltransferase [Candidatus Omnitrophota bacterium]
MVSGASLQTKIVRKIEDIPFDQWKAVFPEAVESYSFYKSLDESGFDQFSFYYCLVYDLDKLVGIATFFLMDFHVDMAFRGIFRRVTDALKKVFPGFLSMKTLFCGLPMGQARIGFKADLEQVFEAIYAGMLKIAKDSKSAILVFKDFKPSNAELFGPLLSKHGFLRSKSLPSMAIDINFDSFEGYLKTLSSSSREGFRRKFKKISNNPSVSMEIADSLDDATNKIIHGLYLQTARQSDVEFEILPESFFKTVFGNMPNEAKLFLWRLEGRIVSFALCLISGDYFVDYYLGFDYSVAHEYNLYLVRFRDLLNWCIANKMKTYEIGQSSYEIKRRLGFNFLPLFVYTKPVSRLLEPFFKLHHRFMMFENFDPVFSHMKKVESWQSG